MSLKDDVALCFKQHAEQRERIAHLEEERDALQWRVTGLEITERGLTAERDELIKGASRRIAELESERDEAKADIEDVDKAFASFDVDVLGLTYYRAVESLVQRAEQAEIALATVQAEREVALQRAEQAEAALAQAQATLQDVRDDLASDEALGCEPDLSDYVARLKAALEATR